jgi:hypothetical protein
MSRSLPRKLPWMALSLSAAALFAAAVLWPGLEAQAQRLRVQVFLTQARIPNGLSERGLLGFARGHRAQRLQESTETNLNERRWLANAVFSFSTPPGDLEFHALFYDVEGGARNFVREMSVFVADRTQRTVLHRMVLPRPTFRPNREMELVVTVRREEVGRQRFELAGEEVRHSGQVDFSDEEASGRD